ncbi:MAG: tetratricopeptide repeat protein, partial [Candidatus Heimdallarchaeaceae archaeon]
MDEKPIENSWKNLMIVFEKLSTVENKDLRQKIFSHVSTILELLVEFLQKEMEIGTEEDLKTFMEYEFKEEEEEFLRNIVCLITDKIKEGFEELRQVPALAFMGNLAQKLGFIEETLEIYEAVIKTDGENIQVLHNLAMFYAKIGKDDQAIKLFEKILELEPENKKALAKLGDLYFYKKQDYETAEKFYKETFENDPSQYSIGINL